MRIWLGKTQLLASLANKNPREVKQKTFKFEHNNAKFEENIY
jgi:hypothetical protein